MGSMLSWMGKPNVLIPDDVWDGFLNNVAPLFYAIVLATILLTLAIYHFSAKRRRVSSVNDVFATFTPMFWILLAIPGGILACVLCIVNYPVEFALGGRSFCLEMLFLGCLLIALVSYLLIVFVPALTPAKFRYRPAAYLHRRKTASR
jgi:hypothetical protein